MTKVSFFGVKQWEEEYLKEKMSQSVPGVEMSFSTEILDKSHTPADAGADIVSIFVDSTVDSEVISKFPNLKFIPTRSTGYDHVDLATCKEKGITVSSVPSYGENTVAEFAFALILSLSRKIFEGYDRIKEKGSFSFDGLQGFDLRGKTIGVVGTGHIGRFSINIAKGFGMNIVAYDPYPNEQLAKELGFEYKSFDDLLSASDVVTIHVPYLPTTHHMFNEQKFSLMKKTAILVNTSRGPIIDTQALVKALKDGTIAGAGLDVLEEEAVIKDEMEFLKKGSGEGHDLKTIVANHVLIDLPNVVMTPHNAFNTGEALRRILDTTVENIKNYLAGTPSNVVK
ncbi:MAG: hydroxyacid dehydrogenase [Candidatus Paceibacterota bacterium]|jgi:D-lactate dehydrogenase